MFDFDLIVEHLIVVLIDYLAVVVIFDLIHLIVGHLIVVWIIVVQNFVYLNFVN